MDNKYKEDEILNMKREISEIKVNNRGEQNTTLELGDDIIKDIINYSSDSKKKFN
jgi:hypothetical protein